MAQTFIIHVGTPLGAEWGDWFADAEIRVRTDGTAMIIASVRDQAMLFGLLLRVRDLGIPLLGLYPGHDVTTVC